MQLFTQRPQNHPPTVIPDDVPVYRIGPGQFYCDDELYPEGSVIVFADEPNPEMEPLNALAFERMRDYLAKLDDLGRKLAVKLDKAFISQLDAFNSRYQVHAQEGRRATVLNRKQDVPIMRASRRGVPKASKIDVTEEVEIPSVGKLALAKSHSPQGASVNSGVSAVNKAVGDKF